MKFNSTDRPYLIHLRFSPGTDPLPPESCWLDKPQRLHFGNGMVEVIGLTNNLKEITNYLLQDDVDADILGPVALRQQIAEKSGKNSRPPTRLMRS